MDTKYYRKKLYIATDTKVKVHQEYLTLIKNGQEYIIAYRYIYSIFISEHNSIPLHALFKLAKRFRLYIVDKNGYLQGRVVFYEKK